MKINVDITEGRYKWDTSIFTRVWQMQPNGSALLTSPVMLSIICKAVPCSCFGLQVWVRLDVRLNVLVFQDQKLLRLVLVIAETGLYELLDACVCNAWQLSCICWEALLSKAPPKWHVCYLAWLFFPSTFSLAPCRRLRLASAPGWWCRLIWLIRP